MRMKSIFSAIFVLVTTLAIVVVEKADPIEDKQALLDFMHNVPHSRPLNWEENSPVCNNWTGVTCNDDQSRVISVRLPGFRFHGSIPSNTLTRLSALQILSLRSNRISGPFPFDFLKLKNLSDVYLQFNQFSGPLPLNFSALENLEIVNLSNNRFSGSIPSSLANLTHLTALNLNNNSFSGDIPELNIPSLEDLDLSNNNLTGPVPKSLQRFPSWAFAGNNVTAESLAPSEGPPPNTQSSKKSKKVHGSALLGIIIGGCVVGFLVLALLMIICYWGNDSENGASAKSEKNEAVLKKVASKNEGANANGRLAFFEGSNLVFDLEDLLRASAEVLGKGTFGTTYRAALEDASTVVVKRLKEVSAGKREFEQQMEVLGSIRHENVVALRAYYYSKDEKLMVYDYYARGSVSAFLHAKRGIGEGRTPLDWDTRVRIAVGTARGIAHIHSQSSGKLIHGNIKATNIFLNRQQYGCVCDLGIATLMSPITLPVVRAPGYRAPEVTNTRKVSQASDVYSYGVLLLELLTGKSPIQTAGSEEVDHLVRWVHSVVREEWTAEVFDVELLKYPNIEEEMVEMLQIGLACASRVPDERPKMADVVKRVEEIRRSGSEIRSASERSTPTLTPPI